MSKKQNLLSIDTSEWLGGVGLNRCSPASRGIWISLLCRMHSTGRSGEISGTAEWLSGLVHCQPADLQKAADELAQYDSVTVRIDDGIFYFRDHRMYLESRRRRSNAERQRRFRESGGGSTARWTATRIRILKRDDYKCHYCGKKATTVDHVTPRSRGGSDDDWNLAAACDKCNTKKNARTPEEAGMPIPLIDDFLPHE